ncbi:hypothetical protein KC865_01245 [Candidatus Kaiserbacteria bacterium]|nr:hypothetical protein [Candidatus Kaiserbacteria bacterium]USN92372.1 MAG: hypothetical protein H6782_00975 [Candidatus Nomurabacteria bacterium]
MDSLYAEFKGKDYLEQWERVQRWYKKLLFVKHGYYKNLEHKDLLGIVYISYLNIHHLKDWVKYYNSGEYEDKVDTLTKQKVLCHLCRTC